LFSSIAVGIILSVSKEVENKINENANENN